MSDLEDQAAKFARELTDTVRFVVGPGCPEFIALAVPESGAFAIQQTPATGIVLSNDDGPLLRLSVEYHCIWDGYKKFLAVEKSSVHVFVEPGGTNPLFRYEFDARTTDRLPSAHIHFHGQHSDLEKAMGDCGTSTPRAKKRSNGKSKVLLSDLHFPVGGARFRPALEDVMQMLIEEFGIRPHGGLSVGNAYSHLAEARERWRRMQVATCVRDAPSEAIATLRQLGYTVTDPPDGPAPEKPLKLRAI